MTEVLKAKTFEWNDQVRVSFKEIKLKLGSAPSLALRSFSKVFEVKCNVGGVGIGLVLSHEKRFIAFFSEKLNQAKRKFCTYDKEFYTIVRSLDIDNTI